MLRWSNIKNIEGLLIKVLMVVMEERDRQGLEVVPATLRSLTWVTVTGVGRNSFGCVLLFGVLFCVIE